MKKKQRDEYSQPQHVSPGERETKNREDPDSDNPAEGRDVPPEEAGNPKRDPNSPWLGGG